MRRLRSSLEFSVRRMVVDLARVRAPPHRILVRGRRGLRGETAVQLVAEFCPCPAHPPLGQGRLIGDRLCVSSKKCQMVQLLAAFLRAALPSTSAGQLTLPGPTARGPRRPSLCLSTGAAMFVVIQAERWQAGALARQRGATRHQLAGSGWRRELGLILVLGTPSVCQGPGSRLSCSGQVPLGKSGSCLLPPASHWA